MAKIGYFGVIVPQVAFYQGYYLIDTNLDNADQNLAAVRQKLTGSYMPPSAVIQKREDIGDEARMIGELLGAKLPPKLTEEDQALLGAIYATMVACSLRHDIDHVGLCGQMVYRLTGDRFFYVKAEIGARRGLDLGQAISTGNIDVRTMPGWLKAMDIDGARAELSNLPEAKEAMRAHMEHAAQLRRAGKLQ